MTRRAARAGASGFDANFSSDGATGGNDSATSFDRDASNGDGGVTDGDADGSVAVPGRSLQFDYTPIPDVVTLPDGPTLDLTSALTYEMWIKPFISANIQTVIAKSFGDADGDSTAIWFEGGALHAGINPMAADATVLTYAWPEANNGNWHHVAFTYDDATTAEALYIDGIVVASMQNPNGTPSYDPSHPFSIGADFDRGAFTYGFGGPIDDVRIFSSARTPAQIATDMTGASPLADPDLAAYLPFNEGSGATTADLSSHHLIGSLGANGATNSPMWVSTGAPQ